MEGAGVGSDKILRALAGGGLHIIIVTGAQAADKELRFEEFAGRPVHIGGTVAAVIHEQLVACFMWLHHRRLHGTVRVAIAIKRGPAHPIRVRGVALAP